MSKFGFCDLPAFVRRGLIGLVGLCLLSGGVSWGQATEASKPDEPDSAYRRKVRDAIDAAGPYDEKAIRRLQQVEKYLAEERWDRALEMLSYALDQGEGELVRLADGQLVPVVSQVHRLLSELPDDILAHWRRQYEAVAKQRYQEGLASGRLELIEQVARQFRLTGAGQQAVERLVRVHADRGEFALAARYLGRLDPADVPVELRLRAVRVWIAVNGDEQAKHWLAAIPPDDRQRLVPGTGEAETGDLLALLKQEQRPRAVQTDWRHPFGDSVGFGLSPGGEPLLLNRWTQPLTQDAGRQSEIVQLNEDVQQQIHAIIPAAIPLAMEDRVVARMWGRVCVYDLATGRLVWETASESSVADADSSRQAAYTRFNGRRILIANGRFRSTQTADFDNSLANPLYRNGVTGLITADQERVYLVEPIEEESSFSRTRHRFAQNQGLPLAPITNELHAFEIDTGRPAWRQFGGIGGDLDLGAFERPLAGHFFFGPPTPIDGELYVIGEKASEIELIALDPASGMKRWSRHIATAPRPISQEPVRQHWNATVSESEGILVCPTTVGWLVAVDKINHSLLWAYRYSPVSPSESTRRPEQEMLNPAALDQRWGPAAPIIVDGRVIFMPPEEPSLVCLDLVTGTLEWKRGQGAYRYIAGVANGRMIAVGPRSIDGIDPATGSVQWTYRIPSEMGYPTGRGVLSAGQLLLPTTHAVLTISTVDGRLLKDDRLLKTVELAEGQAPLGNLVMHEGALVSLAVDGVSVYEQRGHYLEAIEHLQAGDANADRSHYMNARLSFAEGRLEEAAAILDNIDSIRGDNPTVEQVERLRWDVLARLVRSDPAKHSERLTGLEKLAESPGDRLLVQQLRAASLVTEGKLVEAAQRYLELLAAVPPETIIEADGPGHRKIRIGNWVAGKLLDLWKAAGADQRDEVEVAARRMLAGINAPEERAATIHLLSGLPFLKEDLLTLAHAAGERGMVAKSELGLLRLLDPSDLSRQAEVHAELAKLARSHRLERDAEHWESRQDAAEDRATTENPSQDEFDFVPSETVGGTTRHDWGDLRLSVLGAGSRRSPEDSRDLTPIDGRLPFFQQFRVQIFPKDQRLTCPDVARLGTGNDPGRILVPLRSHETPAGSSAAHAAGHVVFLALNGVVQAVSLIEGRVLWSWTDEEMTFSHGNSVPEPMQTAPQFLNENGMMRRSQKETPILVANANYVLVQNKHRLTALDAISGEVRWSCDRGPAESGLVGTNNYLYVMSSFDDLEDVQVLRAIDGEPVEMPRLARHAARTVDTVGNCLLTLDWGRPINLLNLRAGGHATLTLHDPADDKTLWSRAFESDALFARGNDGTFFVLSPQNGELVRIDPVSGHQVELGSVPTEMLNLRSEIFLLTDLETVYVMVNQGHGIPAFFSSEFTAIGVNGTLFAFDKQGGGERWHQEIDQQRLLVQSFAHMPVLFFVTGDQKRVKLRNVWQAHLLAIEKSTGEIVLTEEIYLQNSPMFHHVAFEPDRGILEISYYSTRLRVSAAPGTPIPVQAPRAGH